MNIFFNEFNQLLNGQDFEVKKEKMHKMIKIVCVAAEK